jgi:lipoate---protein ligase
MRPGGPAVLSWSRVDAPALVLGRSSGEPSLNWAATAEEGVTVVRRTSGGGPVLWDRDLLALDVVLPPGHPLAVRDVVLAYRWLGEAFAAALRTCGVDDVEVVSVERARARRPGAAADACFGGLSPFEVTAGGRKVLGLSQARRAQGTLLQAGVPLLLDADRLAHLLGRDTPFAHALARDAAGVMELAPAITADRLIAAVDAEITDRCEVTLRGDTVLAAERAAIDAVVADSLGAPPGEG